VEPRGFYSVQAVDPDAPASTIGVLIPKNLLQELYKTHPVDWHNVTVAVEVLESPATIYHDVRQ